MPLLSLPDVTLLAIEVMQPLAALRVMHHAMRQVDFAEAVLVTPSPMPSQLLHGVRNIVHPMRKEVRIDYELTCCRHRSDFFQTRHCLFMEWDSLLGNAAAWEETFLDYDYIGAPWPFPLDYPPGYPPSTLETCVGNGGFTLMSKALCEAVRDLTAPNEPLARACDVWICRTLRPKLDAKYFRFAPADVAYRFACEDLLYHGQFGLHGKSTIRLNGLNLDVLDCVHW